MTWAHLIRATLAVVLSLDILATTGGLADAAHFPVMSQTLLHTGNILADAAKIITGHGNEV